MRLEVIHTTSYDYSSPVRESHLELRMRPVDGQGQRVDEYGLEVRPSVGLGRYVDGFGNVVHYFDHLPAHESLEIQSHSVIETGTPFRTVPEVLPPVDLLQFGSPVVDCAGGRRLARRIRLPPGAGAEETDTAMRALLRLIAREFEFRPLSTTVQTAVDEVIALRSGVCQDFAHLFIAVARTLGVPARYVSGYVHDAEEAEVHGASHAWAEAYLPERGWTAYDATHPETGRDRYVRVAVGRNYRDAAPARGVFLGSATSALHVRVVTRRLGSRER